MERNGKEGLAELVKWMDERKKKYYKIGWAYLQNQFDIEDVFQNTILIVHEKRHQLREERYFETWVTRIFINECKRIYRQRKKLLYMTLDDQTAEQHHDLRPEVLEGLEQIDELYREVIILKYISGYSQEEIAQILDIAVGTVKSRISRGFKALRQVMERGGI